MQDRHQVLLSTALAKKEEEHPITSFFLSLAASVMKLSELIQIRAMLQVCQIIGQLELEEPKVVMICNDLNQKVEQN